MEPRSTWAGGPSDKPPPPGYRFEKRGNWSGRAVWKCLKCGNGLTVSLLPPRFRKIPADAWAEHAEWWTQYKAAQTVDIRSRIDAHHKRMREEDGS